MQFLIFLTLAISGIFIPFHNAEAQRNNGNMLPPMNIHSEDLANDLTEILKIPTSYPKYDFDNPYLKEYANLQYQISLLEQLIRRQGNIARLEKIYANLGVPFIPPPIPAEICGKIPENYLCPDSKFSLFKKTSLPEKEIKTVSQPQAGKSTSSKKPKKEDKPEITWAEISCTGKKCTAVISIDDDSNQRRSVRTEDILADGSVVKEISFTGVTVEKDGKEVSLRPSKSPLSGGSASPSMQTFENLSEAGIKDKPEDN